MNIHSFYPPLPPQLKGGGQGFKIDTLGRDILNHLRYATCKVFSPCLERELDMAFYISVQLNIWGITHTPCQILHLFTLKYQSWDNFYSQYFHLNNNDKKSCVIVQSVYYISKPNMVLICSFSCILEPILLKDCH